MQVWIASVIIIFALSQFWDWLSHTEFPLSVLGLAGLGLAIASNYDKRHSFPFWPTARLAAGSSATTVTASAGSVGALGQEVAAAALPSEANVVQPD